MPDSSWQTLTAYNPLSAELKYCVVFILFSFFLGCLWAAGLLIFSENIRFDFFTELLAIFRKVIPHFVGGIELVQLAVCIGIAEFSILVLVQFYGAIYIDAFHFTFSFFLSNSEPCENLFLSECAKARKIHIYFRYMFILKKNLSTLQLMAFWKVTISLYEESYTPVISGD